MYYGVSNINNLSTKKGTGGPYEPRGSLAHADSIELENENEEEDELSDKNVIRNETAVNEINYEEDHIN
ncbi:hypothetical protein CEXT_620211 [Caerostris extrusa]|uniref:Uncharacterized protein n=1 Tax=Caerostris extrusa TaxID=172846 RepID=A0AAV4NUW6_CAEEX|nr:hypothetical protein CEXT_620211 [Caerostris extrusa]